MPPDAAVDSIIKFIPSQKDCWECDAHVGAGIEIRLHVDFITISCPCHHLGTQTENPVQTDVPQRL